MSKPNFKDVTRQTARATYGMIQMALGYLDAAEITSSIAPATYVITVQKLEEASKLLTDLFPEIEDTDD